MHFEVFITERPALGGGKEGFLRQCPDLRFLRGGTFEGLHDPSIESARGSRHSDLHFEVFRFAGFLP